VSHVVVTGGAGFIGANLCRELVAAGVGRVVAFDDLSSGRRSNLDGSGAELVEASILDADAIASACDGAGSVVHLAARPSVPRSIADPLASHHANATGTVMVLEAARAGGVAQVIVASSSSVYGANPALPKSEDLLTQPRSPYAASKLATESYALAWSASYGMGVLAFRFFNVFGPLQAADHAYAAVIPAFVSAALDGRPLPVHGDGHQTRDFTYVDSLAAVVVDAVRRKVTSPTPVNLAFGSRRSLLQVVEALEGLLGRRLERDHGAVRAGDVRDSQADQTRLRQLFPDVTPVDFTVGLEATLGWMRATRSPGRA
jgi:UDP-glucose 4-epimerase